MYNQFYFIYSIVNTENNKRYIGYTNDLNRRLYDHMTQLELNQHPNLKMQQEFKKENFKIEILETFINISVQEIANIEKEYIKKFNSFENGYNNTKGGEISSKTLSNDIFDIIFILRNYEYASPVVQKIFNISESAALRMKNKETYLSLQKVIDNLSEEEKEKQKIILEEKYNISEKIKEHREKVTLSSRRLDRETVLQIIVACNQLRAKHKRERRKRKREIVENVIAFIILIGIMAITINMTLDGWINEMDAHAEYNRNYIQQLENNKRDR